jgi:hypothetical protein
VIVGCRSGSDPVAYAGCEWNELQRDRDEHEAEPDVDKPCRAPAHHGRPQHGEQDDAARKRKNGRAEEMGEGEKGPADKEKKQRRSARRASLRGIRAAAPA